MSPLLLMEKKRTVKIQLAFLKTNMTMTLG